MVAWDNEPGRGDRGGLEGALRGDRRVYLGSGDGHIGICICQNLWTVRLK